MKPKAIVFFISWIIIITIISTTAPAAPTDFTLFPEDPTIIGDFLFANKTNEFFHSAYYFASSGSNLLDYRNGISIIKYSDVKFYFNFLDKFTYTGDILE